ncbi:unnamed protein product, partial [Polarella glacialis]
MLSPAAAKPPGGALGSLTNAWASNPKQATAVLVGLARDGLAEDALRVLEHMCASRVGVNEVHLGAAVSACSKSSQWQLALNALGRSSTSWHAAPNLISCNALISACGRGGQWKFGVRLLQHMRLLIISPDEISYNAAMSACERGGQWRCALSILSCLPSARVAPSVISCSAAISSCEKGAQWSLALGLLMGMPRFRVAPDRITHSAVISACEKAGQWQLALRILSGSTPDRISFNAAISACEKAGKWRTALSLLCQMPERRVAQSEISYNAAISACESRGRWELGFIVLTSMSRFRLVPDEFSYNSAIFACAKGGQWQWALRVFAGISEVRVACDAITCNAAISACAGGAQWQPALHMLKDIPEMRLSPDKFSYCAALSACEKGHQWQFSLSLLSEMTQTRLSGDELCHGAAISACEKDGRWQVAVSLLHQMPQRSMKPSAIMYNVVSSALETAGVWEASLALLGNMLVQRLIPDALFAGSTAGALRKAVSEESAYDLLVQLLQLWIAQDRPEAQEEGKPEEENGYLPGSSEHVRILGTAPGVIAIFKPTGVTTATAVGQVSQQLVGETAESELCNPAGLFIVSRLDHPTSGVCPFALGVAGSAAACWLQAQFAGRLVRKEYLYLCEGPALGPLGFTGAIASRLLTTDMGLVRGTSQSSRTEVSPLGREAATGYEVVARYCAPRGAAGEISELMLLLVRPLTGRTHQIRVHLASIGRPLVGDLTYGSRGSSLLPACPRLFLHCREITLRDVEGRPFVAEAPLPADLQDILACLQPVQVQESRNGNHQSEQEEQSLAGGSK